jgi:hypothetical protein
MVLGTKRLGIGTSDGVFLSKDRVSMGVPAGARRLLAIRATAVVCKSEGPLALKNHERIVQLPLRVNSAAGVK